MTLEQIKKRREELLEVIADHQTEIKVAQAEIAGLKERCKHPNKFRYSCMGEMGDKCPDCGYQT